MVEARLERCAGVGGSHVVHFYEHDRDLERVAGEYLADGNRAGEVAIVISTPRHRAALEAELHRHGIDVAAARAQHELGVFDAASTMARFVANGRPDPDRFDDVIGGLVREARATGRAVRVFGEMVALLWDQGLVGAAIELEDLWNELGDEMDFGLLCGYPLASVGSAEDAELFARVCHEHAAVVDGAPALHQLAGLPGPLELVEAFAASVTAPSEAREFVSGVPRMFPDAGIADDAELVTAELATNAVMHARSAFSVTVSRRDHAVRISVRDASTQVPRLRAPDPSSAAGRGLRIVSSLASRWGTELLPRGKIVWAELAVRSAPAPR
jgi:anti-sigma regulatory factor (Ser/Thr protein kinase)